MAKFTGGAVPLIVRLHDILTHTGLLHHINISYNSTQSHTVQAVGAQMQFMCTAKQPYILNHRSLVMGLFHNLISEHVRKPRVLKMQGFLTLTQVNAHTNTFMSRCTNQPKIATFSTMYFHAAAHNYLMITWCGSLSYQPE